MDPRSAGQRAGSVSVESIADDDVDWTWVLDRTCPQCRFDVSALDAETVGGLVRANAVEWSEILAGDPVLLARRPSAQKWSPLEYACHVRDLFGVYDRRLELMLGEDAAEYDNWNQDESARQHDYASQDPSEVARELAAAAGSLADRFDGVSGEQWERTGHRSDGASFTVESFARYLIHDPVHHLWDVRNTNEALHERATAVIPGGVNSPVRAFRSVGGNPYFLARGAGSRVWDVEGNEYIDYVQSYGASILGHAHPEVIAAITATAAGGTTFGAPTEGEVVLAEMLCERVPGMEQVRLVSSGTEATMSAIRLARGTTGRNRIVKFDGNYHGHSDSLLAGAGSGVAEGALVGVAEPDSAGVTPGAVADTAVLPYNCVPTLDETIAAVIVEPVAANMGLIPPAAGFLEGLRAECDRVGALLIFDEVITGFRLGVAGATGAFGVTPDLWSFGKVIGGGLPIGAFGSTAAVMTNLAPSGGVYQAGTLSGNPLATAAGATVLSLLDDEAYSRLEGTVADLADGLAAAFENAGVPAVLPRVGTLLGIYFGDGDAPVDFQSASESVGLGLYPRFFHGMLERGIALAPGPYEVLFCSLAHGSDEVEVTIGAAAEAAAELAAADPSGEGG